MLGSCVVCKFRCKTPSPKSSGWVRNPEPEPYKRSEWLRNPKPKWPRAAWLPGPRGRLAACPRGRVAAWPRAAWPRGRGPHGCVAARRLVAGRVAAAAWPRGDGSEAKISTASHVAGVVILCSPLLARSVSSCFARPCRRPWNGTGFDLRDFGESSMIGSLHLGP